MTNICILDGVRQSWMMSSITYRRESAHGLMILASACERMNWKNAEKIYKRDRYCHASPNSAQTEAVMAGALEVQLAGDAVYFGKVVKKPTIGDDIRPVEAEDIKRANHLMYLTSFLGLVFFAEIRALFLFL